MSFFMKSMVYVIASIILNLTSVSLADPPVEPIYIYGSQPGEGTLDQGEDGGNPFASAFVYLLTHEILTSDDFRSIMINRTLEKSWGLQHPDISSSIDRESWQFLPQSSADRRIALVVVFSDYTNAGTTSLPGARHDLDRISQALSKTGFEVHTAIDPDQSQLNSILTEFSERSRASDIAVVYTTGHGVEVEGTIYLLPGDYPFIHGQSQLNARAVRLERIGGAVQASKANLVFYGGCRNNPFDEY